MWMSELIWWMRMSVEISLNSANSLTVSGCSCEKKSNKYLHTLHVMYENENSENFVRIKHREYRQQRKGFISQIFRFLVLGTAKLWHEYSLSPSWRGWKKYYFNFFVLIIIWMLIFKTFAWSSRISVEIIFSLAYSKDYEFLMFSFSCFLIVLFYHLSYFFN